MPFSFRSKGLFLPISPSSKTSKVVAGSSESACTVPASPERSLLTLVDPEVLFPVILIKSLTITKRCSAIKGTTEAVKNNSSKLLSAAFRKVVLISLKSPEATDNLTAFTRSEILNSSAPCNTMIMAGNYL